MLSGVISQSRSWRSLIDGRHSDSHASTDETSTLDTEGRGPRQKPEDAREQARKSIAASKPREARCGHGRKV
jgi:hypothetical protein